MDLRLISSKPTIRHASQVTDSQQSVRAVAGPQGEGAMHFLRPSVALIVVTVICSAAWSQHSNRFERSRIVSRIEVLPT